MASKSKILRNIITWWLLNILERTFNLCGHKMTLWKLGYENVNNWQVEDTCFLGSPDGWDYCGKHKPKGEKWFEENSP